ATSSIPTRTRRRNKIAAPAARRDRALRQVGGRGRARAAPPALVCEGNGELGRKPVGSERLLDLSVELALDHHADQPGAEARAPVAPRRGAAAFLPVGCPRRAVPCFSFRSSTSVRPCCVRVTAHVKSTWPADSDRLPCLLALVAS